MDPRLKQQKRQDNALALLDAIIEISDFAKELSSATPAKAVFGSVSILLKTIRDSTANKSDYVDLGLTCANVCKALHRGMDGRKLDDLGQSVREAIEQLKTTVEEIQDRITEKDKRNLFSQLVHAKNDKETIATWNSDLNGILRIFNTQMAVNTNAMVLEIHRNVVTGQGGIDGQHRSTQPSIPPPGELPPPPPRACFGRDELIEKIVNLAENLTPIALIGPGGIGKTSIALTVLSHDRIKAQFGDNCRFIRCDEFPPSHTHFLSRLSKVIGAGVENPEGLAPLRPFLSSRKMILVLDNAESILDPQGTNAREIYSVVEELSQVGNICLCLTSRISTIPPTCKTFDVPTLSVGAARDTFYRIYKNGGQSDVIDRVLQQLDLHPLSITLLATVAHQSKWDANQLRREWRKRRRDMLQTHHNTSLAITIELSLTSPMFQALGPDARELLGVVAFFPQGVNENNLNWLFPVLLNRTNILDNFCVLSLTHRSNKFITMLAPLRDYLYPKDPTSSRLLCATRDHYFHLLSVNIDPRKPGYEKARWIKSEDVNVEHLLDVFTSINKNSVDTWDACYNFMKHLYWRKPRLVTLAPKIEGLPDSHPSKPRCLRQLSLLFDALGNRMESKRLLIHTLKLWKERGNNREVAKTLRAISEANRHLGLKKEGVEQVKEALEVNKRLGDVIGQGKALRRLSWLLHDDGQLDAAEEAASEAIKLFLDKGDQLQVCACHRVLGSICRLRGEIKKAINHYEATLRIASSFSLHGHIFWAHYSLADLFFDENRSDKAHRHIEYAKSHTADSPYRLGRATELQARFWYKRRMLKEAKSEALVAADIFEKTGAAKDLKDCRVLLRKIEETASRKLGSNGAA